MLAARLNYEKIKIKYRNLCKENNEINKIQAKEK